jgi:hypothetical protein
VSAALRDRLIFDVERGDPGGGVLADRADHVERVAVAVVGVRDDRHGNRLHEPACLIGHLAEREQPDVRAPEERRGCAVAGHVDGVEPRLLDQPGREGVVGARGDDQSLTREQFT